MAAAAGIKARQRRKTWLDAIPPEQAEELRALRARFQAGELEFSARALAQSICSVVSRVSDKTVSIWLLEKQR